MPFAESGSIRYFYFESLAKAGAPNALFTRQGGVSPRPWESLNLGGTVGDEPQRVAENYRLALAALGFERGSVYDVWQVHSADVICADAPRLPHQPHQKADAILTDRGQVTLVMRFADCVPILLYAPRRQVVGLVHAGWKGTVDKVVQAAVRAMAEKYNVQAGEILAGIGPSIGADHYEIGPEVIARVRQAFDVQAGDLLPRVNGSVHFDLWAANRLLLEGSGVEQIETAGLCTACHVEDWFSHRGEKGKTGRFGALIRLRG
jgi:hypothetical protein